MVSRFGGVAERMTSDYRERMRFVAIARPPARPEEAAKAMASALGLALAEARMRMAAEVPAVIARLDAEAAGALVRALLRVGVAAVSVDEPVPSDKDRVIARSFTLSDHGATFTPRSGPAVEVAWPEVVAVLRGLRATRSEVERSEKSKGFSIATAVATGGLKMTRTSTRTTRSSQESSEQVVLVYARDVRTVLLCENQVDFSCLHDGMQPSSTGNMAELARRIHDKAKAAFYDEKLLRLGRRSLPFLGGGEAHSGDRTTAVTSTNTSGSLDVLAEVMRQALREGLVTQP